MKDRRRYKRFIVEMLNISTKIPFARHVNIYDISQGGICLKLDKRLDIGNEYLMRFEGKGRSLALKGEVKWSFLSESFADAQGNVIPIYKTGFKFIGLSKDNTEAIAGFIEDHKKEFLRQIDVSKIKNTRLHLRFAVDSPQHAVLNFREGCRIKRISLGGMLIESLHLLEKEVQLPMEIILTEGTSLSLSGRVASCIMNTKNCPESYDIGIEFMNMSDRNKALLTKFIGWLESMDATPAS